MLEGVHPRSFFDEGGASGLYDKARPSYPSALVDAIFDRVNAKSDLKVVEFGSGTGIFTRLLLDRPAVGHIQALEPSKGMRDGFQSAVISALPQHAHRVQIASGTFTSARVADNSADLICIAQAFHWIGTETEAHEAAMREFARILKPEGILAFVWNLEDRETAWVAKIRDLYEEFEADSPQYRHGYWKDIFNSKSYKTYFESPKTGDKPGFEELHVSRQIPTTETGVVDRVLSKSYIQVLPAEKKEQVAAQIRYFLSEAGDARLDWVDRSEGVFNYPYKTDLYMFRKSRS